MEWLVWPKMRMLGGAVAGLVVASFYASQHPALTQLHWGGLLAAAAAEEEEGGGPDVPSTIDELRGMLIAWGDAIQADAESDRVDAAHARIFQLERSLALSPALSASKETPIPEDLQALIDAPRRVLANLFLQKGRADISARLLRQWADVRAMFTAEAVATHAWRTGETVLEEHALACVAAVDDVCAHCLGALPEEHGQLARIECPGCRNESYCGFECANAAWLMHHSVRCGSWSMEETLDPEAQELLRLSGVVAAVAHRLDEADDAFGAWWDDTPMGELPVVFQSSERLALVRDFLLRELAAIPDLDRFLCDEKATAQFLSRVATLRVPVIVADRRVGSAIYISASRLHAAACLRNASSYNLNVSHPTWNEFLVLRSATDIREGDPYLVQKLQTSAL